MVIPKKHTNKETDMAEMFRNVPVMEVNMLNWPLEFSYCPQMKVRMFHDGEHLYVRYDVEEKCTAAKALDDNGPVWEDSCAELFIKPKGSRGYYNFEASCIGTLLLSHRTSRNEDVVMASDEVLSSVRRIPSLPHRLMEEKKGDNRWNLTLVIPVSALFADSVKNFDGMKAELNVYKCGDRLSSPHFLSLFAVSTEHPDFHRPEFFREVDFE